MALVELSITYLHDFQVEPSPIICNVKFGVAVLRCGVPQILNCAWEEVVLFPSLESATIPLFEGIRLMDMTSLLAYEVNVNDLNASGFCLGDDNRVARLWAQK